MKVTFHDESENRNNALNEDTLILDTRQGSVDFTVSMEAPIGHSGKSSDRVGSLKSKGSSNLIA